MFLNTCICVERKPPHHTVHINLSPQSQRPIVAVRLAWASLQLLSSQLL